MASVCACAQPTDPSPSSSGSAAVQSRWLYTVSPDHNAIAVLDREEAEARLVSIGARPSHLALWQDNLLITLQSEGALEVVSTPELQTIARIDVGAEPAGVIVDPRARRAYVAVSLQDEVVEINLDEFTVSRRIAVGVQPRWLALHPDGHRLYVTSAMGGLLTSIELESGLATKVDLPGMPGQETNFRTATIDTFVFERRFTGDLEVSPDGEAIYAPALFVNTNSAIKTSTSSADRGYQNRFIPAIVKVPLDTRGDPLPSRTLPLPLLNLPMAGLTGNHFSLTAGYPVSARISKEGDFLIAAMAGQNGAAIVRLGTANNTVGVNASGLSAPGGPAAGLAIPAARPGLTSTLNNGTLEALFLKTDAGPRGLAIDSQGDIYVTSRFDRTISKVNAASIRAVFAGDRFAFRALEFLEAVRYGAPALGELEARGQRLFFGMNNGTTSGPTANVACASCHFEGRNDGLTWNFDQRGPRQTPSLAGAISMTAPFGWEGAEPTVASEALATSHDRMDGALSPADAAAIEAFLDQTPEVSVPRFDEEAKARGKALFERADVGCINCHNGPRFTDNQAYDLFGVEGVVTRSLVGLAASAPYLHDGSAPTLRALLDQLKDGSMGSTESLSEDQMADLELYLKSL